MIVDNIKYHKLYHSIHPGIQTAFAFIMNLGEKEKVPGRIDIEGDNLFAILSKGIAPVREGKLEVHRKYLDLHYAITGADSIGYRALERCNSAEGDFNDAGDYLLFNDRPEYFIRLNPGDFAICFPQDAHVPLQGDGPYSKVVIKIKIS